MCKLGPKINRKLKGLCLLITAVLFATAVFIPKYSRAENSIEELREELKKRNAEIERLEKEAKQYRQVIQEKRSKQKTLKYAILQINRSINELKAEIELTQERIEKVSLEIEILKLKINDKRKRITSLRKGLAKSLQVISEKRNYPLLIALVKNKTLSSFIQEFEYNLFLQRKILSNISLLKTERKKLEEDQDEAEKKYQELASLQNTLKSQKEIQQQALKQKDELLRITKNQERLYQKLLADREQKRELLEREIKQIEEKIRIAIDPSSLPPKKSGVLGYPLPNVELKSCWAKGVTNKNCITQFFGNTSFSKTGAYNGKGHNGLDFRANIGTPVYATESGIIEGVGDTDYVDLKKGIGCKGVSYGKWILVKHLNNLSSIYGHLSGITVSVGQRVKRGDLIGYSGASGYATGPHLHLSVAPSKAVKIHSFSSRVCQRTLTIPVVDSRWYLNPLDYL